jgi:hypothetical protein
MSAIRCALKTSLALTLFAGCGAPPSPQEAAASGRAPNFSTAEPALAPELARAIGLLARATGRSDIAVTANGLPVAFGDDMFNARRGDYDCAQTTMALVRGEKIATGIRVDRTPAEFCMGTEAQLTHELIHALAPNAAHSETGIFSERGSVDPRLDAASLEALCGEFDCVEFHSPDEVGTGPE